MNKVYKVIWSKVKGCYVVVSELTKKNGKSKYEHICREGVCELSLKAILCVLAITGSCFVLADGSFGRHTVWRR